MGKAWLQGQVAVLQVTASHPLTAICMDCVNPWMFAMLYACGVHWLPVSRLNSPMEQFSPLAPHLLVLAKTRPLNCRGKEVISLLIEVAGGWKSELVC